MITNIEISFDPVITSKDLSLYNTMNNLVQSYVIVNPLMEKFIHTSKGENKDEFGYYISYPCIIPWVIAIMKHFKMTKVMDLGCGMGVLMAQIRASDSKIITGGVDNERIFVQIAKRLGVLAEYGNLAYLNPDMIKGYNCFYMWEPFCINGFNDHANSFIEKLALFTKAGNVIMYTPAGQIGQLIEKTKAFDEVRLVNTYKKSNNISQPFRIFIKK